MQARFCFFAFDALFESHDAGRKFTGPYAPLLELGVSILTGINYTFIREPSFGSLVDPVKLAYDGCFGSMQRNESDVTYNWNQYPFQGPNLTQVVDGSGRMALLSGYRKVDLSEGSSTDVMDMVKAFSLDLWIILAAFFAILSFLLRASLQLEQKSLPENWNAVRDRVFWKRGSPAAGEEQTNNGIGITVVACLLKQAACCDSYMTEFRPVRTVYTIMTLLSFYAGYYLTSMIKTEMVVVKPPITITTYDELIESGRRPLWCKATGEMMYFQNARKGSKERTIYEIGVKMGLKESIVANTIESFMTHGKELADQKSVALGMSISISDYLPRAACRVSRTRDLYANFNALLKYDPDSPETQVGVLMNDKTSHDTAKRIKRNIGRIFQANLREIVMSRFVDFSKVLQLEDHWKYFRSIEECYSSVVVIPYPELQNVPLHHYKSLLILSLALIFLSLIVFYFEKYLRQGWLKRVA